MILRVLMLLVLLGAAWMFLRPRARRRPPASPGAHPQGGARDPAGAPALVEPMVDCAHCGLHLPSSEAVRDEAARAFCSQAHRLAGPRRDG